MTPAPAAGAPLFGSEAPRVCTNEMMRAEIERELVQRRHVYRRLVDQKKMLPEKAERQIWILEQILARGFTP